MTRDARVHPRQITGSSNEMPGRPRFRPPHPGAPRPRPGAARRTAVFLRRLLCLAVLGLPAGPVRAGTFTEDFTTTAFRDAGLTTAAWDTAGGTLHLPAFAVSQVGGFNTSGSAWDVSIDGDLAVVADNADGVHVLDVSDPSAPALLGTFDTSGNALGVEMVGDLVYVADSAEGLEILDISDPTSPTPVGGYNTSGFANDVTVAGEYAFVADITDGMVVVNVSNPATPTLAGTFPTIGSASAVALSGNHAYVADDDWGLQVVNIVDPANPSFGAFLDTPGSAVGIAVDGNRVYIADGASGIQVVDVTDPTSPGIVGSYNTPGFAYGVAVEGDFAYVADGSAGLLVLDISGPGSPAPVHTFDTTGNARGVAHLGRYAFVAGETAGLQVIEVTRPALLTGFGTVGGGGSSGPGIYYNHVSGNHAYAISSGGLHVFDISDPENASLAGYLSLSLSGGFAIEGDVAYLGAMSGMEVVDISDPTAPAALGSFPTPDYPPMVRVSGNRAYLAVQTDGVFIVDVTDPGAPLFLGSYVPGVASVSDLEVVGDIVYAITGLGLYVVDVSDPLVPVEIGSLAGVGAFLGDVAGDYAYLARLSDGLEIVDVSDPTSPVSVTNFPMDFALSVDVFGDLAFVGSYSQGVDVIDVSDPTNPVFLDSMGGTFQVAGVDVSGDYVFLSDSGAGLDVRRLFQDDFQSMSARGVSLPVDGGTDTAIRARVLPTQSVAGVSWEVSADGGASYTPVLPGPASWTEVLPSGSDVVWRATLESSPAAYAPSVSEVTVDWLHEYAAIASVTDVPNDQGKQVRVSWSRSGHDFVGDSQQIVEYAVYREIDPDLGPSATSLRLAGAGPGQSELVRENAAVMAASGWDFVTSVPVLVEDDYAVVVPTLADSTPAEGDYQSVFRVTALTATPGVFFHSPPDSGRSVDNLAPSVPQGLAAVFDAGEVALSWEPQPEEDFRYFRVYRSTDPGFEPGPATLVRETTATSWVDAPPEPGSVTYKITALDFSGNESGAASFGSVTGVATPPAPPGFALLSASPNPVRVGEPARIAFALPRESPVTMEVFAASGRKVRTLVRGTRPSGVQEVVWNGRDDRGQPVPAGVYFTRLEAGSLHAGRSLVVLQ